MNTAILKLLESTQFLCVRSDCEVALGLVKPRAYDTVERARQRCMDEIARISSV